jgi:hypothetical protein
MYAGSAILATATATGFATATVSAGAVTGSSCCSNSRTFENYLKIGECSFGRQSLLDPDFRNNRVLFGRRTTVDDKDII